MSIAPVVRQIVVSVAPDAAYAAWTGQIGEWWPLNRHSVYEKDNSVEFVGEADGSVKALRVTDVALSNGRFEPVPGTERELPAQLVAIVFKFGAHGPH